MKKILAILSFLIFSANHTFAQDAIKETGGAEFNFNTSRIYDFGPLQKYSKATHNFEFKNTGSQPLIINAMQSQPNDIQGPEYTIKIKYPEKPVKPSKKGVISITINTLEVAGSFKNEIYVTSNVTADDFPLLLVGGAVVPAINKPDEAYKPLTSGGAAVGAFLLNNIKK
jgi:hypothetical protein